MKRTLQALEFIKAETAAGRKFPSAYQIAFHMGWKNDSSVNDVLARLAAHGHIVVAGREPSGRGWRYTYALKGQQQGDAQ